MLLGLTLVYLFAGMAHAQSGIYVEWYSISNPFDGWAAVGDTANRHAEPPEPGLTSGSSVTITNAGSGVPSRIFATYPPNTDIGDISISLEGFIGHAFLTPITLTGDEYTATAASLGGGAVGLVPFSTHRESCSPVHGR